ncbi:MAG TPA: SDR family oxidoreductase [Planctomycetota bacterium]|nr:SDR family oxidoreductase [Planctomycetota bacterium]
MSRFEDLKAELESNPRVWLVTGAAGFIGSHLVEALLRLNQRVIGVDNFITGSAHNLEDVCEAVGRVAAANFQFIRGDIQSLDLCMTACRGVDYVLHQAALGSVPRSLDDPIKSHRVNVDGHVNMLVAAKDAGVQRFVYASSSSVYGDHPDLPKVEDKIGQPLSPYAMTKLACEQYSNVFARCYGLPVVGMRYFNVFGARQNPAGPYAAVIPRWIGNLLRGEECTINGDGLTSRDFCYVENVIQANLLAATAEKEAVTGKVFNVACGDRTTLNELFEILRRELSAARPEIASAEAKYLPFRKGDVAHSLADISRARELLGYEPTHTAAQGLHQTAGWYLRQAQQGKDAALRQLNQTMRIAR